MEHRSVEVIRSFVNHMTGGTTELKQGSTAENHIFLTKGERKSPFYRVAESKASRAELWAIIAQWMLDSLSAIDKSENDKKEMENATYDGKSENEGVRDKARPDSRVGKGVGAGKHGGDRS
jgi:hypothetical protein